jgi:NADH-quinone oxidoreductase subunit H
MEMVFIELLKIVIVIGAAFTVVPLLVYLERKISAGIQGRIGPNRVGPFGLLQPLADGIKFLFKEDITPTYVDRFLFFVAPVLVFFPPALVLATIPFGNVITLNHYIGPFDFIGEVRLQIADLNIGILFVMAILSLGVYGIAFGGWASNNKYSLLGGLRASAQVIAYEISLGLSIIAVIMMSGTVSLREIVERQATGNLFDWYLFQQPLAFLIFGIAAFAENNRLPFDMPECEAELVGGYHTEYGSMKFALFFLGEYIAMLSMSCLIVTLFLGGWSFPGIVTLKAEGSSYTLLEGFLSLAVFGAKVSAILLFYIWIRWMLPRFKWQQIMHLGWKILIPVSLANIAISALIVVGTTA